MFFNTFPSFENLLLQQFLANPGIMSRQFVKNPSICLLLGFQRFNLQNFYIKMTNILFKLKSGRKKTFSPDLPYFWQLSHSLSFAPPFSQESPRSWFSAPRSSHSAGQLSPSSLWSRPPGRRWCLAGSRWHPRLSSRMDRGSVQCHLNSWFISGFWLLLLLIGYTTKRQSSASIPRLSFQFYSKW